MPIAGKSMEKQERKHGSWLIGGLVALAAIAVVLLAVVVGPDLVEPELSPEEVAQEWVESHVDATGEQIAEFLLGSHWVLRELGGEYVESRINQVVKWRYGEARSLSGALYEVRATAAVEFTVDISGTSGSVSAGLPFLLTVDHDAQTVTSWNGDPLAAVFSTDIPALKKVDDVVDALGEGDCIGAARAAGVPDTAIDILEKPADQRGTLEASLLRKALEAAGLAEKCANLMK